MEAKIFFGFALFFFLVLNPISAKSFDLIKIKNVSYDGSINVTYTVDNTFVIGDQAAVEIWVADLNNTEIIRTNDSFRINQDGKVYRTVIINPEGPIIGEYKVYIAEISDLNNPVSKGFFAEKPKNAINPVFFIIFPIVVVVLVFLAFFLKKRK